MGTCTEWPKVADAVIEANPRNRKATKRGRKRLFNDAIHALRMRVERTFAWEDTLIVQILCLSTDSLNGSLLVSFFSITLNRFTMEEKAHDNRSGPP